MFVYSIMSSQVTTPFVTNAVANTENDSIFIKPGARNIALLLLTVGGKGVGLTALSGIAYRVKKWFTTSSAIGTGTAITPAPKDPGAQVAKATSAGSGAGTSLLTSGTGGPTFLGGCVSGGAGPGGWTAVNPDAAPVIEGSANQSLDLFVSSGTVSMNYEANLEIAE